MPAKFALVMAVAVALSARFGRFWFWAFLVAMALPVGRLGPRATVVTLMADTGLEYLSTDVYRSGP